MLDKVLIDENLYLRGCNIVSICSLCKSDIESSQHNFFNCYFSRRFWAWFHNIAKFSNPPQTLDSWWSFCTINKYNQCSLLLKAAITYILSNIWEASNHERFKDVKPCYKKVINKIKSQLCVITLNSCATYSTSMEDFKLLKAFNIKVKPLRAPQI